MAQPNSQLTVDPDTERLSSVSFLNAPGIICFVPLERVLNDRFESRTYCMKNVSRILFGTRYSYREELPETAEGIHHRSWLYRV
jgi:hypothetical protein